MEFPMHQTWLHEMKIASFFHFWDTNFCAFSQLFNVNELIFYRTHFIIRKNVTKSLTLRKERLDMSQESLQKQKILIVDDSEINRSILADILEEEYEIIEAEDGVEAVSILQEHALDISAVLLDIVMPHMDGFGVLTVMNQKRWIEDIPVIIISAESGSRQIEKAYDLGATDFIMRPFDALLVHRRVVNTILLYTKQKKLLGLVVDQIDKKERRNNMMVDILSHIVEFRNGESGQHIIHIRTFTEVMLRQLQRMTDCYELTQAGISTISIASALHDIGKIAIDEKILNKPGRLTKEEFEVIKTHSEIGAQMLESLPDCQDMELVKTAWEICRWHHERYDGKGYPDGLVGEEIPISAQIVALADVYDALTSDRCYKKAISHEESIRMILNGECGAFSPLLLDCLKQVESVLNTEFSRVQFQEKKISRSGLIKEMLHGENFFASERSLYLLDQERMKYNFFSAMTEEIQFEYTAMNNTLKLHSYSAQKLGLNEVIIDPMHDEEFLKIFGEEMCREICDQMRSAKPDDPPAVYKQQLQMNGQLRWHRATIQGLWSDGTDPKFMGMIGKIVDIHDSFMQISELERKATHDAMTGLLNRASATEQILRRIEMAPDGKFVLIIFDLDNLKQLNDTYGHTFGDRALKYIAQRARQSVRSDDILARIGGDEFMMFLQYEAEIEEAIGRIFRSIIGECGGTKISISMGIAKNAAVGNEYRALFHAADQALYAAKKSGRGRYLFYDDSMREILLDGSCSDDDDK